VARGEHERAGRARRDRPSGEHERAARANATATASGEHERERERERPGRMARANALAERERERPWRAASASAQAERERERLRRAARRGHSKFVPVARSERERAGRARPTAARVSARASRRA
jgi:hypothetical protein